MTPSFIYPASFLFGALIGSFLNVCILRIPEGESIAYPGSHCPRCGHTVRWYDNIPILSFILLRGQCRHCHSKISWQYPVVEALTGFLAMACFWKFSHLGIAALWFLAFVCPLLVISFIDLEHFLIPDLISIPFIGVGLIVRLIIVKFQSPGTVLLDSLYGILAGAGALFLIGKTYELIQKREGIGMGDVKLAAMIGAFLGWKAVVFVFVLSSLLGSVIGIFLMIFAKHGLRSQIPYGPFLSLGAILQLFFGQEILRAYFNWVQRLIR
jgi:leader peptidase (prepilin peptidase)/N-methyltransferase